MFEQQFIDYLNHFKLNDRMSFTKDELFKAFCGGGTASLAFLGKAANELTKEAEKKIHDPTIKFP